MNRHQGLVTARDILDLRQSLLVSCLACRHDAQISIVGLIECGLGDRPVKDMRFRCSTCGSRSANPRLDRDPLP
jgi:transposase-like protein